MEEEFVTVKKAELDEIIHLAEKASTMNERSDWNKLSEMQGTPVLLSDYEHKAHLIDPARTKTHIQEPDDILHKDLSLSVLDRELAYIYGIKQTCSEEWLNLGFPNLAKRRKVHLQVKLAVFRSVGGIERFLQTASASASTDMNILNQNMRPEQAVEQKTGHSLGGFKKWFK